MLLDTMFIYVTAEKNVKLSPQEFLDFANKCLDPISCSDPGICKNVYTQKNHAKLTQQFFGKENINMFPHKLLDLVPTDVFLQSRNKLYALGFWGTYAGYVASKIGRLSVESIRMILAGCAYGVSFNDLVIIGLFVDHGKKTFKFTPTNRPKFMTGVTMYDNKKIMKSVLGKNSDYFLGSVDDFHEELYDEFIEPLMISRWHVKNLRKYGPSQMVNRGKKYGIDVRVLVKLLEPCMQIRNQLKKLGYISTCKDVDFTSGDLLDNIVRIKQCIHAGFKLNVSYLEDDGIHYRTNTGLRINPSEIRTRNRPPKILFGSLFTTMSQTSPIYEPIPLYVSSLSGII